MQRSLAIFPLFLTPLFATALVENLEHLYKCPLLVMTLLLAIILIVMIYHYRSAIRSSKISTLNYNQLFDNTPEGILFVDENALIHTTNNEFCKLLKYSRDELILNNLYSISPDIQPETEFFSDIALKMFIDKAKEGKVQHFEWCLIRSDGKEIPTEVLLTKIESDNSKLLFIARDISELKKLRKEKEFQQAILVQQSKLAELGNMIGAIAHQWKQPLNAIGIIAQDLPEAHEYNELNKERVNEISSSILSQVKFMSQTIDDFRNFYKPTKEAAPFEVIRSIRGITGLLKSQLIKHNIELNITGDDSLKAVGYESEFRQVILNLITNVKDVVDEKALEKCVINIDVSFNAPKVVIVIADNAGGIPEKIMPRIFNPFVSTKADKGTGIGLSIAKTIIEEKMHGKISVKNQDGGARFTIELVASKEN